MNIPSATQISGIQQAATQQRIDVAVLAKANQLAKSQGEAVNQLIESAAETTEPAGGDGDSDDGHSLNVIA